MPTPKKGPRIGRDPASLANLAGIEHPEGRLRGPDPVQDGIRLEQNAGRFAIGQKFPVDTPEIADDHEPQCRRRREDDRGPF